MTNLQATRRKLVFASAVVFAISAAFPLIAGFVSTEAADPWVGYIDVAVAALVVMLAFVLEVAARGHIDDKAVRLSCRVYRALASVPLLILAGFLLLGDQVKWDVLVAGLAWRGSLLMYVLPAALAVWGGGTGVSPVQDR